MQISIGYNKNKILETEYFKTNEFVISYSDIIEVYYGSVIRILDKEISIYDIQQQKQIEIGRNFLVRRNEIDVVKLTIELSSREVIEKYYKIPKKYVNKIEITYGADNNPNPLILEMFQKNIS